METLGDLRDALATKERVVAAAELGPVKAALQWLERCRSEDGYWGVEDVAVTSLCSLAIAAWRPDSAPQYLELSARWLIDQASHGAWESYWDTAVALQVLYATDLHGHPAVRNGVGYLRGLDLENEQLWGQHVHHASQILRTLSIAGSSSSELHEWSRCIQKHLDSKHGIYVCSQAIHALIDSGTTEPEGIEQEVSDIAGYLRGVGRPSEGDLRNFAPAVLALSDLGDYRPLVNEKAGAILAAYSRKRAWYKDPRQTAWALLALHGSGSVSEIVIDKPSFNTAFSVAFERLPAEERRLRLRAAILTGLLMTLVAATLALVLVWNHTNSLFINGIAVTGLGLALPLTVGAVIRTIRA
ncbi:MAG TPA: hypothetical protein VFJ64_02745 [Solirubrobacterales bacterium]|nr:hypothetical protein [Solirubrobacterales bacterium]